MTREQHLEFCKKCINRKMDFQQGTICCITNEKADFESSCENFELDNTTTDNKSQTSESNNNENSIPTNIINKLKPHENLGYAIAAGLLLAIISALIWAVITVTIKFQIAYMAIGVGFIVGIGIRYFGAGISQSFGIVGAIFSLLGCLLGNLFSQIGFIAHAESLGYIETLSYLDLDTIAQLYKDSFSIIDLLFYGFAIFQGYKFAFRTLPENYESLTDLTPQYNNLRKPILIGGYALLIALTFLFSGGTTGNKTYYYNNEMPQSSGPLINGKENGLWTYYNTEGNIQVTGTYTEGIENGVWTWYDENGSKLREGFYKNGLEDSVWISYYPNGKINDSTFYSIGRIDGVYTSYYDNGQLAQKGLFNRDQQDGEWVSYNQNNTISTVGNYNKSEQIGLWQYSDTTGKLIQELYFIGDTTKIINKWNNGKQLVTNGNGTYKSFHTDGITVETAGEVKNSMKTGIWKTYYSNGKLKQTGKYLNNEYFLVSLWDIDGKELIKKGNGEYILFATDSINIQEKGLYKNGLKEGKWIIYYPNSSNIQQEINYKNGVMDGKHINYYANGNIITQGSFDNGKKTGEWVWNYESGRIQCAVFYLKDKKEGEQLFYGEMGNEAKKETYKNGVLITETLL